MVLVALAGCHKLRNPLDEGPNPALIITVDELILTGTYGTYPANWTHWGHLTLVNDEHNIWDRSEGCASLLDIHRLDADRNWSFVDT